MNSYNRGDVVLVRYQLSEAEEPRLRPALVLSSETYHQGRDQLVLAAITSSPRTPQTSDTVVQEWHEAGLLGSSLVTGVLLTVTPESIERRLGTLAPQDMQGVDSSLHLGLGV